MIYGKWILILLLLLCACSSVVRSQSEQPQPVEESYTKVGEQMPSFTVTDLKGNQISIANLRGKIVLVNFWATWCGPCLREMPRLEKQIWRKFKSDDFVMVAIAREDTVKEITAFKKEYRYSFPMAADLNREVYNLFGNEGIPRTYVVGVDGKILFQSVGYDPAEFGEMKKLVETELKKLQKAKVNE